MVQSKHEGLSLYGRRHSPALRPGGVRAPLLRAAFCLAASLALQAGGPAQARAHQRLLQGVGGQAGQAARRSAPHGEGGSRTSLGPDGRPVLQAVPRPSEISIDGRLDDEAWAAASPISGFIQREPVEGRPAEQDTEVRVLFDNEAIYVGLRMWDSEPERIARQLYRRDGRGQADYIEVAFDPNLDRRTGYLFGVSAANVQNDEYLYDDNREDRAWDAVWASGVVIDDKGWTAELRIPLSQIRYEAADTPQTWGFNVHRFRVASNERTFLALISQLQKGTVSQFGRIEGIQISRAARRLEALPYAVAALHQGPAEAGNPFFDGTASTRRVGMDLSYGLGAAFTLDATINPDFGQVEADPAVINLSAFETFFQERRPFFVEDARVFDFSLSGHRNQLFYSRRIGRSPRGRAPSGSVFSETPENATILGAAKLAGRTSSGLSVGALAATTAAEEGRALMEDGSITSFLVEPRAEFGVVSLQQDLNEGASQVAGIVTAMRRDLPADGAFDYLPSSAYSAGLRFEHQWNDREWALWGFFAGSHVRGSEDAMLRLQRASNHYFQRPDATRLGIDSTATSMTGAEWRLQFERRRGEHWTGAVWAAQVTEGFEINDLGFSQTAERLDGGARIGYREIVPGRVLRSYDVNLFTFHNWSHEALDHPFDLSSWRRARTRGSFSLRSGATLLNYWRFNLNASYSPEAMSRSQTRGGPMMVDPAQISFSASASTDRRKQVSGSLNVNVSDDRRGSGGSTRLGGSVTIRPSDRLELRLEPNMGWERDGAQYVTATSVLPYEATYGTRYLFSDLERRTFSMETRLDWTFTPHLSLQLFAQPLLSSGDYVSYKQLALPGSYVFRGFTPGNADPLEDGSVRCLRGTICSADGDQFVDFDGDGVADYSFADRDFNIRSLVGNVVLRWEYRPGSTVFVVWQRRQRDRVGVGDFDFGRDVDALFGAPADDRFIIKVNYWLGL
ncbi:MAG: DUF5916 domain-containing protein [Gemmatimonadota bacterium]